MARVGAACGVDIVTHAARPYRRLAPAHVPPDRGNRCEVAAQRLTRWSKRWPLLNPGPCKAAVQRPVDPIDSIIDAAATLVHAGDEHSSAVVRASSELNVADEAPALDSNWSGPGDSIVG